MNPEKMMKELRKLMSLAQEEQEKLNATIFSANSSNNLVTFKANGHFSNIELSIDDKIFLDNENSQSSNAQAKSNIIDSILESYNKVVEKFNSQLEKIENDEDGFGARFAKITNSLGMGLQQKIKDFENKNKGDAEIIIGGDENISINIDGNGRMLSLDINEDLIDLEEKTLLQDLIIKVIKDTHTKKQQKAEKRLQQVKGL